MIKIKKQTDGKRKKRFAEDVSKKKLHLLEPEVSSEEQEVLREVKKEPEEVEEGVDVMEEVEGEVEIMKEMKRKPEEVDLMEEVKEEPEDLQTESQIVKEEPSKKYTEYYLNGYCLRNKNSDQYYAQNESGNEIYWRDSVNTQIYAYKQIQKDNATHTVEYPAIKNGNPDYIYDHGGKPRYPIDLVSDTVIFPRDPITNEETYLKDKKGNIFYPENKFGQQFYRKDAEGNDVPIHNIYAQFSNGTQIYPKKANGDQFYLRIDNKEVPAIEKNGEIIKPYYAVKENGDEIYPREYLDSENENLKQ